MSRSPSRVARSASELHIKTTSSLYLTMAFSVWPICQRHCRHHPAGIARMLCDELAGRGRRLNTSTTSIISPILRSISPA